MALQTQSGRNCAGGRMMEREFFQCWAAVDKHQNKVVNLFEIESQGKEWFRYYKGRYQLELAPVVVELKE